MRYNIQNTVIEQVSKLFRGTPRLRLTGLGRRLQAEAPMVPGSLYLLRRKCGKPTCRLRPRRTPVPTWSSPAAKRVRTTSMPCRPSSGGACVLDPRVPPLAIAPAVFVKQFARLLVLIDQMGRAASERRPPPPRRWTWNCLNRIPTGCWKPSGRILTVWRSSARPNERRSSSCVSGCSRRWPSRCRHSQEGGGAQVVRVGGQLSLKLHGEHAFHAFEQVGAEGSSVCAGSGNGLQDILDHEQGLVAFGVWGSTTRTSIIGRRPAIRTCSEKFVKEGIGGWGGSTGWCRQSSSGTVFLIHGGCLLGIALSSCRTTRPMRARR